MQIESLNLRLKIGTKKARIQAPRSEERESTSKFTEQM